MDSIPLCCIQLQFLIAFKDYSIGNKDMHLKGSYQILSDQLLHLIRFFPGNMDLGHEICMYVRNTMHVAIDTCMCC